jgi:dienelactone hydrolase
VRPKADQEIHIAAGGNAKWRVVRPWSDHVEAGGENPAPDKVSYAFANIRRATAGKARVSLGSDDAIRAWVNGKLVLRRDGVRTWAPDADFVDVDLNAGDNALLIKVAATSGFVARVLESGAVSARTLEIAPAIIGQRGDVLLLRTDGTDARAAADEVKVEMLRPGGEVVYTGAGKRGSTLEVATGAWPEGPYEARFSTRNWQGLLFTTHQPWYKGDPLVLAQELAAEAAKSDAEKPAGFMLKMLAAMVDDRLGKKLADARQEKGRNPWQAIHSPLMEYAELMLERAGKVGRVRPHGFVRLAWMDETDHTPQYCRAYLPHGYTMAKRWPLVLQLHGFNPANPVYWDWWSADSRHNGPNTEFAGEHPGVIYIEPHGRGNTQYLTFGDADVMRCMAEARKSFAVDENRTYLTGDSMGGWGTWNVATRHPELFAAIAPVFGGLDYHAQMPEEDAAKLSPAERYIQERNSSWAMADGLINTPIFVHHGDADAAVNVEWSRWGVRLMQRWGYDIRYREYPGKVHEALQINNGQMNIEWFLQHVRDPAPPKVRIRSAELRNANAWWVRVTQAARPLEFITVDAEMVDRNTIRLDTTNVTEVELSPPASILETPSGPVTVVWNGVASSLQPMNGQLRLTAVGHKPAKLRKTPSLPGSTTDIFNTPFAVVVGTISKDPALRQSIEAKSKGFVDAWTEWQKFAPRVFKDTEMADADIARYSLLLLGGADANAVTAKLAGKLPLKVSADRVVIDGKAFAVSDAGVQMLYPNPRNDQRYVWLFAGTSPAGFDFTAPLPFRTYQWDFLIVDGTIPAVGERAMPERTHVVSGMFDQNWRIDPAYLQAGEAEVRARGRRLTTKPANVKVPHATLDSYAGRFALPNGRLIEVERRGDSLWAKAGSDELDLAPLDQVTFYGRKFNVWITFLKDASGKVTGFSGHQPGDGDFEAKKE